MIPDICLSWQLVLQYISHHNLILVLLINMIMPYHHPASRKEGTKQWSLQSMRNRD